MQPQLYNPGAENTEVQTFDFNGFQIRSFLEDGEAKFIGADLARTLEYRSASDMFRGIDDEDKGYAKVRTPGGEQNMLVVNESGLYTAIMRANTKRAKPFRRWVTDDILPAIRKTGSYAVEKQPETALEWAEKFIETEKARLALVEENKTLAPKAEVYDKILTPEHTFGFRDLCKALREHFPINENDIKRVLRAKKILTPARVLGRDRMDVYSAAIDKGWAVRHPAGTHGGKERFQVRFTNQTLEWLLAELAPLEEVA